MITLKEYRDAQKKAVEYLRRAGIVLNKKEEKSIEVADFGLGRLKEIGLQILVYVNTERCCAKELVLFPNQICPEHLHPDIEGKPGKEETFRCRWGEVYLYIPGKKKKKIKAKIPQDKKSCFTVFKEIVLKPGDQYTLPPNTLHWFQAGKKGAIVSEFSTRSVDEKDIFTDPQIKRKTEIKK